MSETTTPRRDAMVSRTAARRRLMAVAQAREEIEEEWGDLTAQIMAGHGTEPLIGLHTGPHAYPDDHLANDVRLAPWEVFRLLQRLHDALSEALSEQEVSHG